MPEKTVRFHSHNAHTRTLENGAKVFVSYTTIVALAFPNGYVWRTDRTFSVSTSRQLSRWLGENAPLNNIITMPHADLTNAAWRADNADTHAAAALVALAHAEQVWETANAANIAANAAHTAKPNRITAAALRRANYAAANACRELTAAENALITL